MKVFMQIAVAVLMAAALCGFSGCQTFNTEEQQVQATCASATAALRVLTIAKTEGKITPEVDAKILAAADKVDPVCLAENPTWNDTEVGQLRDAAAQLKALAAQFR